ncbi:GerAB/ArcD/ProY family transporter [Alicyclobacillus fodiniaquatilis]|uniref:Endospore germination permease n=1 Tax=Alicyclobacillus fodiniaquatilis TaxID=1661150 RepID=A0ABW4JE88_9BACL
MSKTKEQLSNIQIFIIVIASSTAFGHFVYVHLSILYAGRDAWISLILAALIGIGIVYIHLKFAISSDSGLYNHVHSVFGKWFGRLITSIYVMFFMIAVAVTIKVLSDFMDVIYPTTPPSVFLLAEFILIFWVVHSGVEVIGRTMQFLLPILMVLGILASVLSTGDKDFTQIFPIFERGMTPIFLGALPFIAMFSELVAFCCITQHARDPKKLPKQAWLLVTVLFFMFISPVTGPIMTFGENMARNLAFPTYTEIQYIRVTNIIERMDIVGISLWTIGSFFRISMFTFAIAKGLARLFDAKRQNAYLIPTVMLIAAISLSLMKASREEVYHFIGGIYLYLALAVGVGIPLFTGIVALIRKKFGMKSRKLESAN